ncbi:MAG: hypothetical protein AABY03_02150 [Nanoarchaeota archaeon]
MAVDWITIGLSILIFTMNLVTLLILFRIKSRISGRLNLFFIYFFGAILFLILLRLQDILKNSAILNIIYSRQILAFFLSLFLFLAVYNLYKSVIYFSGGNKREKMKQHFKTYRNKLRKKIAKY